ncbi:Arabinose efflux permease [Rubellimicrobium thermophilum DSM 16684]|uniref:Arabinose efflux permease n=1 Tax=Rubellimicrobium thermophilum DSM 16684 TaxID=1123069 RepID=S9QN45_9RHOB|nr:MFS transporter [Rubellimicrobium thermophilum]EPX82891.1 Arabinose efflux permease [Rubellimicrobium thermophilum DSM 16684]
MTGSRGALAAVGVVGIPIFLAIANQTMISVALPAMGRDLGEFARLPWLVIGYMFALTVAGPVYGLLGDSHGRGRMLRLALAVYAAGAVLAALAPSIVLLILGRIMQGLGGGGLMSLSQALIADLVPPRERGRAQGYVASIGTMASALGPILGGLVVAAFGWRTLLAGTVPLAALAAAILWRADLREEPGPRHPFDLAGFLWLNAFTASLIIGIEAARGQHRTALMLLAGLAALISLTALRRAMTHSPNPILPPALFALPAIARANGMVACHGAALVSLTTILPLWQSVLRGDGVLQISMTMLALTLAFGLSGVLTGNLITLTGRTATFPTLALPLAAAGIAVLATAGPSLSRLLLMGLYLWIGLFMGTVMSVIHTTVQDAAPTNCADGRQAP